MAMVIKRSGRQEAFDVQKIKNTLGTASDELGRPMSHSDIKLVVTPVLNFVTGRETVSSREIYDELIQSLRACGFHDLADAYMAKAPV